MRFGLALPQYDFSLPGGGSIDWPGVREWAQKAEDLGFDTVWLSDHLFWDVAKYGGPAERQTAMECFTTLAAIAATTERIRLGSLVLCNDLRSPALVAKMTSTLDVLSHGRVEVGLGAGWYEPEYHEAGIAFDPPGVRVERLAEAVQIVTGMLSSESFSYRGKHYQIDDAWNLPRAPQSPRPPVWVGGKGDRIVRLAARHADGFNTVWAWTPKMYAERVAFLEHAAERAGRDPKSIRRSVGLYCLGGSSGGELKIRWERYLAASGGAASNIEPEVWGADKLFGGADEMLVRIDEFRALGVEEVILCFGILPFQIADPQAPEWFAAEVITAGRRI